MSSATFASTARSAWHTLLELVYPQFCKVCDERIFDLEHPFFCAGCWESSPRIEAPLCTHCGRPHVGMVGFAVVHDYPCAECRDKPNPHIESIRAPVAYRDAMETAVKLLKFGGRVRMAAPLAAQMVDCARAEIDVAACTHLMFVPLHKVRQRTRGFNQAELLARAAHGAFPNAVLDTQLQRIRPTRTQSRLSSPERHSNVRGAFAYLGEDLKGAHVVLIDDVVTTAGTVTECARVLKRAGAARVDVLAAALATRDDDWREPLPR